MARPITPQTDPDFSRYTDIIDVRAPAEFAEDHVPGALNLYVFDDAERARVGTLYKQHSPFEAKKAGAALMARNIAHWLETYLADKPKGYHPLVYCWRGGQRSMGMATILSRIDWDTHIIAGGYKRYRQTVAQSLEEISPRLKLRVVSGLTGTAKTRLLYALRDAGEQIIDLEGLAKHRGSLLGDDPDAPQPAQKYFESLLAQQLRQLDPARRVWIESESNRIGRLHCPEALWKNLRSSKLVQIEASLEARIEHLIDDYAFFLASPQRLKDKLGYLRQLRGDKRIAFWHSLIDAGDWRGMVEDLLLSHYDQGYQKSIRLHERDTLGQLQLPDMRAETLHAAAQELVKLAHQSGY